jgi:F-type H+-transporting ATPase subunit delta
LNIALRRNIGAVIKEQMGAIARVMENKENKKLLVNRMIPSARKMELFSDMDPTLVDFLKLVVMNKREESLQLMAYEYIRLFNERFELEDVDVLTKDPLSDKNRADIERSISKMLNKKVIANYIEDKSIIGGVIVKYDNKMIDGTVSGVLLKLMENLTRT